MPPKKPKGFTSRKQKKSNDLRPKEKTSDNHEEKTKVLHTERSSEYTVKAHGTYDEVACVSTTNKDSEDTVASSDNNHGHSGGSPRSAGLSDRYVEVEIEFQEEDVLEIEILTVKAPVSSSACLPTSISFNLESKGIPSGEDLKEFERDPTVALLAMAANSGQSRFASTNQLHPHASAEVQQDAIRRLQEEIAANLNSSDLGAIVDKFQTTFDKNAMLLGCACCGIRAFQMGSLKFEKIHIENLALLRLTDAQTTSLLNIPQPYQRCISVYQVDDKFYHLHPELLENNMATLCETCYYQIRRSTPEIPKFSVAAGIDFGNPERLGLTSLTVVEELLIAQSRLYVSIVKLIGTQSPERQSAKKGHVITFPQPDGPTKLAELQRINSSDVEQYPRIENLAEFISVVFVGSRRQFNALVPSPLKDVKELRVRTEIVYLWLHALKILNPLYRNVEIVETTAMHDALNRISSDLIDNATIVDNEAEILVDRLTTPEGATDVPVEEIDQDCNESSDRPLPASFLTRSIPVSLDKTEPVRAAFRGLLRTFGGEGNGTETANEKVDATVQEGDVETAAIGRVDNDEPKEATVNHVDVEKGTKPFNEFQTNDMLFYASFPFLFLFGRGLERSGSISEKRVRHMMFQCTGRFATCERLIFLIFDQLQRHAATRVLSSRVKCNPVSFDTFAKWMNDPNFATELAQAARNPTAKSSTKLLEKLTPHIKSCTTRIPFTSAHRGASISNLIAMRYMYGMPSIFFTYAPDDINGILNLRMAFPQNGNGGFPADGSGFAEAIRNKEKDFHTINIAPHHLRIILAKGPVAAAEVFRLLTEAVFEILLGTPTDHSTKRTQPLPDRKPGVFGTPIASFGCVEEQARGSLHLHVVYWGGLPAHLLQCAASYEALISAVAKALDGIVKGEVDADVHVEHLLQKAEEIIPPRPALTTARHPLRQPTEFNDDVQQAAIICNCHSHSQTCKAGKLGKKSCRMRRPQPIVLETSCCQIVPFQEANGVRTYKKLPEIGTPNIGSQITRNMSRLPIPERDNRLVMWEIKRSPILPIETTNEESNATDVLKLTIDLLERYENLSPENKNIVNKVLLKRNGLIVEFNEVITALLGCNTNVGVLGSEEQAKSTLCYLLKYVTKPTSEITHSISLIQNARRTVEEYPSVAEDSGTNRRTAMHILNRITNKISSTIEVSSSFASLAILGGPAEFTSCTFFKVFVIEAIKYSVEHPEYAASVAGDDSNEFENLPGDEYEEDDEQTREEDEEVQKNGLSPHQDDLYDGDLDPEVLGIVDDDSPAESLDVNSTAQIYTGSTGKIAVPQHIHYAHRGCAFKDYSLYEFASIVDVVPKKKKKQTEAKEKRGRPSNGCFPFAPTHPLYETHELRLRSKIKVPVLSYVPKPPPTKPGKLTEAWKKQARIFARFFLVLFRPWEFSGSQGSLPGSLSWNSLCNFISKLENGSDEIGPTFLDIVRMKWITNTAHGLRTCSTDRAAVQMFSRRDATIWNVPDNTSMPIGAAEKLTKNAENEDDEGDEADLAQLSIDILRAQAASDDNMGKPYSKDDEYLEATMNALSAIMGSIDNPEAPPPLPVDQANLLIHTQPELEPDIDEVITRLSPNYQEEDDEMFDVTGEFDEIQPGNRADTRDYPDVDSSLLNECQRKVLDQCITYFQAKRDAEEMKSPEPEIIQLLVHGGPGTGKSYLTSCIYQKALEMGYFISCMAPTGIAASNLPNGRTIHNQFGFKITDLKSLIFLPDLPADQLNALQARFKSEKLIMIVIDEISYISPEMLAQIDNRLRQLMGKPETPFGGIAVLLMGDFFQLPPVATRYTLYGACVKMIQEKKELEDTPGPKTRGTMLFSKFKMIELTQQMRAALDVDHTNFLNQLRMPRPGQPRINADHMKKLQTLTSNDIKEDTLWQWASIVVTSNKERMVINNYQSSSWARYHSVPRFVWEIPLRGRLAATVRTAAHTYIYQYFPAFTGCFVSGASGYLTENINPSLGLSNGTQVTYHSLTLHPEENMHQVLEQITINTGSDIRLQFPPVYIHVEIPNADPHKFIGKSLVPNKVVIPIRPKTKSEERKVYFPLREEPVVLKIRPHAVEFAFGITVHKMQGQTCERIILDLNSRPFSPQIDYHGLYVALSRVKQSQHLRILPLQPLQINLNYLFDLNPPLALTDWIQGFDQEGNWRGTSILRNNQSSGRKLMKRKDSTTVTPTKDKKKKIKK